MYLFLQFYIIILKGTTHIFVRDFVVQNKCSIFRSTVNMLKLHGKLIAAASDRTLLPLADMMIVNNTKWVCFDLTKHTVET